MTRQGRVAPSPSAYKYQTKKTEQKGGVLERRMNKERRKRVKQRETQKKKKTKREDCFENRDATTF
jgi:hypothetical protein